MRAAIVWLLTTTFMLVSCLQTADAATRVPLVINEAFPDRAVPWPITTGVPFPRGALKQAENCRLVDDLGNEQQLQTKVAATWDAEKTSIRWLTIDFIAQPGRKYALEFGEEVVAVSGKLAGGVPPDLGSLGGEHYYIDQNNRRFSSAGDKADRVIAVEPGGSLRSSVRVEGYYTGPGGERIAKYRTRYHFFGGLPIIKVVDELRFTGSTKQTRFRDIGFTLNLDLKTEKRKVVIDQSGEPGNQLLSVDWQGDTKSIASYQQTYRHYGNPECIGEVAVATNDETKTLATSAHVGEWIQVADDRAAVTASLRWFWQQFPKEWEVTKDALTLHYWSPRAGELDFGKPGIEKFFGAGGEKYLRAGRAQHNRNPLDHAFYHADLGAIERGEADGLGINKHHEFWLCFTPAADARIAQDYARHAAVQPLCLATGEWNCSTDVFGPLASRPNDSKYEAAVDKLFDLGRQGQDDFGDYGWWLFGAGPHYSYHTDEPTGNLYADSRRFEFHTYGKETQLWWNYLRSGERKFYDWAIPSENHWVDIAVAHEPTKIHCDWLGGVEHKNRTLHWRPGEWSIDNPTHYIRTHDRAEAWLRGGAQFWASYHRTLETTTLAYYLTGDERYNDVIKYWRDYWRDLAGKTNRSKDIQPWHREQAWYQTFKDVGKEKTWAEMIRDYAPFSSGSRHQQTLFFSLATLYEHTWDPQLKQVLQEYSTAFLDPQHPIGVWRSQDNSLPAHAEAPAMGHFWVPALWKYERVTRDPRMKDIFARYFAAGYAADPFREYEDVGVYSNTYVAYAYYFTRDPRFITLAQRELEALLPYSLPLSKPQEINERLYNPYAPAKTFTAIPRLIWTLQQGARDGIKPGPGPLRPQRTAIAIYKSPGKELTATLWGFERNLSLYSPEGEQVTDAKILTTQHVSEIQPFDRLLPNYECYLHQVTIPATATEGYYLLTPKLELSVLQTDSTIAPRLNAGVPVCLKAGEAVVWQRAPETKSLQIVSALPQTLRVLDQAGKPLPATIKGNTAEYALADADQQSIRIECAGGGNARQTCFQIAGRPLSDCWVVPNGSGEVITRRDRSITDHGVLDKALAAPPIADSTNHFVSGRFGKGVQVVPKSTLHIPDHVVIGETKQPLFDPLQGTIEFWVRRRFDERLTAVRPLSLLTNGLFQVAHQPALPLNEWAHIALVWAPYHDQGTLTYIYVNGRDAANYRSLNWAGYSSPRPSTSAKNVKWLEAFVAKAIPGTEYEIDELRVSNIARYADLRVTYGPQQTFNPIRFQPPTEPFAADDNTTLLLHFDDDLKTVVPMTPLEAKFVE